MWGVSPEMFSDQAVVDIKAKINEDSGFSSLLMLGIYTHGNQLLKEEGYSSVAGGISGYDGILAGFGGDRTVIRGLSQSHVDSGINIYGELNSKSDFEQYQANIYGNRFAEMLGVENPGIVFQKMQIESELTQKQAQPDIYNERLNQAVGITGGFAIFEDIRGDSSEEKAREIVERAREIEKEDNERGFNLHLPFGMEQLVEKAPVSALEVINRWEIQRESAAIGSSLEIQSGSTNDTLVSPDQLRLRRK